MDSSNAAPVSSFDFQIEPILNFENLLKEAENLGVAEANAMSLATLTEAGRPQVRIVLYKGMVRGGFSFFTNYLSPKGQALLKNPAASLNFFWQSLARQIRVEGEVYPLTSQESEDYFRTRNRLSQVGAWASLQSQPLAGFDLFHQRMQEIENKFAGREIPCPPHWGGFHLIPTTIEFWFGRDGRLHERYCYVRENSFSPWLRGLKYP